MDLMLGADRVAGSQLIKQADVLMLHHMVPGEVPAASLGPTLDLYGPRTCHGSSLSPAVHAGLLARAGRLDQALELFRLAARLDLDDVTGTTAGGLHLATMGGLWQALAYGFLGLRARRGRLHVDPHLPDAWSAVTMRFSFNGALTEVRADRRGATVRRLGADRDRAPAGAAGRWPDGGPGRSALAGPRPVGERGPNVESEEVP